MGEAVEVLLEAALLALRREVREVEVDADAEDGDEERGVLRREARDVIRESLYTRVGCKGILSV